jgi:hypothetical protein
MEINQSFRLTMMHYLMIIFLTLMGFCTFASASQKMDIKEILNEISIDDQNRLERFFRYLVAYENFGYVLFGKKPMALMHLHVVSVQFDKEDSKIWKYNFLLEDYKAWLKYQHLLPMDNYVLRSYPHKEDSSFHTILFLKRQRILEVIHDNLSLFKEKLGPSITPEKILSDLKTKYNILEEVFHGNHDLLGIVLGYGVHNSVQFQKRYVLFRQNLLPPPYDNETLKKVYEFNAPVLDSIYFTLTGFPHDNKKLFFIDLPYFAEDAKHPESIQVKENFFADQKLIGEIYSEGKFLEITLRALLNSPLSKGDGF